MLKEPYNHYHWQDPMCPTEEEMQAAEDAYWRAVDDRIDERMERKALEE